MRLAGKASISIITAVFWQDVPDKQTKQILQKKNKL